MNGFLKYFYKRLLQIILTMFILITLLFFMFRVVPGDPLSMYIDAGLGEEATEVLLQQYGLDKPILEQYIIYVKKVLRGDFGISFQYGKPAINVIGERFWNTFFLMITSLFIAFSTGIVGGVFLAWKRGTLIDSLGTTIILIVRSAPVFWTGMIFLSLFAFRLEILPLGGINTPGTYFPNQLVKFFSIDFLRHLILPALTAGIYSAATPLLVMRTSILEVIKEDFIELARARGIKENQILFKHVMRNALLPTVTVFAVQAGLAIGGIVLVETVFRWPGMGREIVLAVAARDYPVAQTAFFLIGAMTVIFNLIADILYAYVDPRVVWN